jgi:hypothetical protein
MEFLAFTRTTREAPALLQPEQRAALRVATTPIALLQPQQRQPWRNDMRIIGVAAIAAASLLALGNLHAAVAAPHTRGEPLAVASADIRAPSDDQVVELADASMRAFMTSVRQKSMQALWNHISPRFRETYSVARLDEVFKDFYDLRITGDPLAGRSPIFTGDPTINEAGNLVVDGYYPTTPWRVSFHLVYAMEGRSWKLVGINVNARPPTAPAGGTGQSTAAEKL